MQRTGLRSSMMQRGEAQEMIADVKSRRSTTQVRSSGSKRSYSDLLGETSTAKSAVSRLKRIKSARDGDEHDFSSPSRRDTTHDSREARTSKRNRLSSSHGEQDILLDRSTISAFANSGDTVPFTEQTQLLVDQLIAQPDHTHELSKRLGLLNSQASLTWTALDSPSGSKLTAYNSPIDDNGRSASLALSRSPLREEAGEMIEQYLNQNRVSTQAEDISVELSASSRSTTRSRTSQIRALDHNARDELTASPSSEHKTSKLKPRDHQRADSRQPNDMHAQHKELRTVNPANLQLPDNSAEVAPMSSMGDEIVVAGAKPNVLASKRSETGEPVTIEMIVKALSNGPKDSTPSTSQQHEDSTTSMLPPPAPPLVSPSARSQKTSKKSRRSHTTIFEDHVEMHQAADSLTLKQQQARRKAALDEVSNGANKTRRGRACRKSMAVVDENITCEASTGAFDTTLIDSASGLTEATENVAGLDSASVKLFAQPDPGPTHQTSTALHQPAIRTPITDSHTPFPAVTEEVPPQPSPEALASNANAMPPSPTVHSPIRIGTSRSYRVGLSKRQRIPSLLRVVRPTTR